MWCVCVHMYVCMHLLTTEKVWTWLNMKQPKTDLKGLKWVFKYDNIINSVTARIWYVMEICEWMQQRYLLFWTQELPFSQVLHSVQWWCSLCESENRKHDVPLHSAYLVCWSGARYLWGKSSMYSCETASASVWAFFKNRRQAPDTSSKNIYLLSIILMDQTTE